MILTCATYSDRCNCCYNCYDRDADYRKYGCDY